MFEQEGIRMINRKGESHGTITARINDRENFEVKRCWQFYFNALYLFVASISIDNNDNEVMTACFDLI